MSNATRGSRALDRLRAFLGSKVVLALLPVVLVASLGGFYWTSSFVETDPGFCTQCHVTQSQYLLTARGEHHDVVCQECHQITRADGMSLLLSFLVGRGNGKGLHKPEVPIGRCRSCHVNGDQDWLEIGNSAGHIIHCDEAGIGCMECHARSMHRFGGAGDSCGDCHPDQVVQATSMEQLHCLACHNFLTREESLWPSAKECLSCHRSRGLNDPGFADATPMAGLPCWSCHHPHQSASLPTRDVCIGCHDRIEEHGLHRVDGHDECDTCHEAHGWRTTEDHCLACHDIDEDHPGGEPCWGCHKMSRTRDGR